MDPGARGPPVKIYNAVYSSVQVYECMIRGIAVMRRRHDSFVNATQILKVAGVDKGRRTKILEKEILPGKHEIVQGGYGKYQGTWIPLDRGRDIAEQFGVAPLLAPLFDFTPSTYSLNAPPPLHIPGVPPQAYLHPHHAQQPQSHPPGHPLAPPPILPGSALRLLNQGRAQGLFTPSTSSITTAAAPAPTLGSGSGSLSRYASPYSHGQYASSSVSNTPPPMHPQVAVPVSLKRNRSDTEVDFDGHRAHSPGLSQSKSSSQPLPLDPAPLIHTHPHAHLHAYNRPASAPAAAPPPNDYASHGHDTYMHDAEGPSPTKRARMDDMHSRGSYTPQPPPRERDIPRAGSVHGQSPYLRPYEPSSLRPSASLSSIPDSGIGHARTYSNGTSSRYPPSANHRSGRSDHDANKILEEGSNGIVIRQATTAPVPRPGHVQPVKDPRRAAVMHAIGARDDPDEVLRLLAAATESADPSPTEPQPQTEVDLDIPLDASQHTALHLAAALCRPRTVQALVQSGADVHRGNVLGETALVRMCLGTHVADAVAAEELLNSLHASLGTIDSAGRSVLHHVCALAGVKDKSTHEQGQDGSSVLLGGTRAPAARYYLDTVLLCVARRHGGAFKPLIDLQDEHGDTALNIAARVGNRALVRALLDVGADRMRANRLGLRPGDYGVESEEFAGTPRAEDVLNAMRSAPSATVQKSQDVIADMTAMIQSLSTEFGSEVKVKQDALDVTQRHLRAATRELAEQRRQIQAARARCSELERVRARIRNVRRALAEEEHAPGWDEAVREVDLEADTSRPPGGTGIGNGMANGGLTPAGEQPGSADDNAPATHAQSDSTDVVMRDANAEPSRTSPSSNPDPATNATAGAPSEATTDAPSDANPPPSAPAPGPASIAMLSADLTTQITLEDFDPPLPPSSDASVAALVRLRRIAQWHARSEAVLRSRLKTVRGASAEKEFMCRRIVALCTGVPGEKVDEMLNNLVVAMESEGQMGDIGRISGFMQKVRDGII
ncbi:hypothetical protein HGRIS_004964 [Hohenbuehelia grisea]|uniref:HTH APSES-type domain-containing protein n=1 Tax=Hohenbuehelia grisea TaxID=104357 RepID=A0ABR3JDI7_9AGAR